MISEQIRELLALSQRLRSQAVTLGEQCHGAKPSPIATETPVLEREQTIEGLLGEVSENLRVASNELEPLVESTRMQGGPADLPALFGEVGTVGGPVVKI